MTAREAAAHDGFRHVGPPSATRRAIRSRQIAGSLTEKYIIAIERPDAEASDSRRRCVRPESVVSMANVFVSAMKERARASAMRAASVSAAAGSSGESPRAISSRLTKLMEPESALSRRIA